MDKQLLPPALYKSVLTHDRTYVRAVALLNEEWETADQPLYRNAIGETDVAIARQLQAAGLVAGTVPLNDYQAVSRLLSRHSQWFSPAGSRALLAPFQD